MHQDVFPECCWVLPTKGVLTETMQFMTNFNLVQRNFNINNSLIKNPILKKTYQTYILSCNVVPWRTRTKKANKKNNKIK